MTNSENPQKRKNDEELGEGDETLYQPDPKDIELLVAASNGELEKCKNLLESDADPCFQDVETGMSILMAAAGAGHKEVVQLLLDNGAPWNAVDRKYLCAGDYAANNGHQEIIDLLLNFAVISELLLSKVQPDGSANIENQRNPNKTEPTVLNSAYLSSKLEYINEKEVLADKSTNLAVMMSWEEPLMKQHADFICHVDETNDKSDLNVLNVGFGMGIVDSLIQENKPKTHVVIEAHPEVLKNIKESKFDQKPGVEIAMGRWQDCVPKMIKEIEEGKRPGFDGIFFDTYAEDDLDMRQFHEYLPKLLKPKTGRYSYYNGLCPDNVFFHGVACETMKLLLNQLGLTCQFKSVKIDVSDPKIWKNLASRYWYFDTYYLPECTFDPTPAMDTN